MNVLMQEYSQTEHEEILEEVFKKQAVAKSQVNVLQHHKDGTILWTVEASGAPEGTLGMLLGATTREEATASVLVATVTAASLEQVLGWASKLTNPKPAACQSSLTKFITGTAEGLMLELNDFKSEGDMLKMLQTLLAAAADNTPAKHKLTAVKRAKTLDTRTLVGCMSFSYPLLRATATDTFTHDLLILVLVSLSVADGTAVVLPWGLKV